MRRDKNLLPFGVTLLSHNDVVDPEYVAPDSDIDRIVKEIFAVDPVSGLPKGDLAYYLSPDGNPQVKLWLERNLLQPRAKSVGSSVEGVTDDLLVEYARKQGESVSDYSLRLKGYYDSASAEIEKLKSSKNE